MTRHTRMGECKGLELDADMSDTLDAVKLRYDFSFFHAMTERRSRLIACGGHAMLEAPCSDGWDVVRLQRRRGLQLKQYNQICVTD